MISETEIAQHLARSIRGKHSPGRLTLVTGAAIVGDTFKDLYLDNETRKRIVYRHLPAEMNKMSRDLDAALYSS